MAGKTEFKVVASVITHPGLKHVFCPQLPQGGSDGTEETLGVIIQKESHKEVGW